MFSSTQTLNSFGDVGTGIVNLGEYSPAGPIYTAVDISTDQGS